jgi:PHAX RNA-binding domain
MSMTLAEAAPTAQWIAGMLGEKQPGVLVLLRRGVSVLGDVLARDILHDVAQVEAAGGIYTRQRDQRLTPCGVYLRLLGQLLDADEARYVFGTPRRSKTPRRQRHRVARSVPVADTAA